MGYNSKFVSVAGLKGKKASKVVSTRFDKFVGVSREFEQITYGYVTSGRLNSCSIDEATGKALQQKSERKKDVKYYNVRVRKHFFIFLQ